MNMLLVGVLLGTLWPLVALWLFYAVMESLPKAMKTYINAWHNAIKR